MKTELTKRQCWIAKGKVIQRKTPLKDFMGLARHTHIMNTTHDLRHESSNLISILCSADREVLGRFLKPALTTNSL